MLKQRKLPVQGIQITSTSQLALDEVQNNY